MVLVIHLSWGFSVPRPSFPSQEMRPMWARFFTPLWIGSIASIKLLAQQVRRYESRQMEKEDGRV